MKAKKLIVSLLCVAMLFCSMTSTTAAIEYTVEKSKTPSSVLLGGERIGAISIAADDVHASHFHTTAPMLSVSVCVPSYSNSTGYITVALYAYTENYQETLAGIPLAEYTFVNFADNGYLTIRFDENDPLPAGEYMLVLRDAGDDTPEADGGSKPGIGLWYAAAHESQRYYYNGKYDNNKSMHLFVEYQGTPESPYATPTAPVADTLELSPKMDSVIDGTDRDATGCFANQLYLTKGYVDGYVRIQSNGAVKDPRIYVTFPGTSVNIEEYPVLVMKIRKSEGAPTGFQIYYQNKTSDISEQASLRSDYADTSDWQHVILNFGLNTNITGELLHLRWDMFHETDAQYSIDIEYMAFFKDVEAAKTFTEKDNFDDYREPVVGEVEEDAVKGEEMKDPAYTAKPTFEVNGQRSYNQTRYTYVMDASKDPDYYWGGTRFGLTNKSWVSTDGGVMKGITATSAFSLYTKKPIGDAYAVTDGFFSFDLDYSSGSVSVAQRLLIGNDTESLSGLWFKLNANGDITVSEKSSGCRVTIATGKSLTGKHIIKFDDTRNKIEMLIDGVKVISVSYDSESNGFEIFDAAGKSFGSFTSSNLPPCGYASISLNALDGSIDNVTYTNSVITQKTYTPEYTTDYSTWTATDDLDRTTPMDVVVEDEKYVGVFYFLNHGANYSREPIYDTTKLYLEGGASLIASTYKQYAGAIGAYWAEPYFGYYTTSDTWIYRKHAQQLAAADVDFIFIDLSNNVFYTDALTLLFDTWLEMRKGGQTTPDIVLMFGDMPYTSLNGLFTLKDIIFNNPDYQELLFNYDGKPLLLGNTDTLDDQKWTGLTGTTAQTKEEFTALLNANPDVKAFYETGYQAMLETFTIRKSWAWQNKKHNGYWDWLQDSPQNWGTSPNRKVEQITVALGQHAHTDKGRSFLNNDATYNKNGNYGFGLSTTAQGLFFAEQFETAMKYAGRVKVMMITGWNEWTAGVQSADADSTVGQTSASGFQLIDQFSPEYSRDAEPMKLRDGEGFGDNYYYQMVSYIRQFKGTGNRPTTVNGGAVNMSASDIDAEWTDIGPAFTDGVNDTTFRSALSAQGAQLYVNNSARNDIAYAKVSQDADALYFYVKTAGTLINVDDAGWMNLYVDLDGDASTGWEGYDIVINRSRTADTASIEKFADGKWEFQKIGDAEMVLGENSITLKVSRSVLGLGNEATSFNFKWADNSVTDGDILKFMDMGDAAPDDRFSFAYTASSIDDETSETTETDTETETKSETDTQPPVGETTENSETTEEESGGCGSSGCGSIVTLPCISIILGAAYFCMKKPKE